MIRRPKPTDTEEDLISQQESFLASGELPSASFRSQQAASAKKRVQVGEKRRDYGEDMDISVAGNLPGKDIVQLHPKGGTVSMEIGKPPVKRSRFKEERERAKAHEAPEDPFVEMERRDTHITKVLADIQEHEGFSTSPVAMPTRMTKKGFPTVHQLDFSSLPSLPGVTGQAETSPPLGGGGGMAKPPKKKKSLFAQQLEKHGLEYFGIEVNEHPEETATRTTVPFKKDIVDPVTLGLVVSPGEKSGREREKMVETESEGVATVAQDMEVDDDAGGVAREEFESDASQAWKSFLESSLISGEGLVSVGVSSSAAREEVTRIHRENVERLSGFSEGEILKEKERIQQTLGPEILEFLKKRHNQKLRGSQLCEGDEEKMAVSGEARSNEGRKRDNEVERSHPGRWLHMDVVEKDKIEWMTDVPLYRQETSSDEQPKEVRFSLDGLVIHRNVVLPVHLGLHHHGDEPQAAGYTLTELLPLCRSTILQQRVLGLNTLARISQRARQNEYIGLIEGSVVARLLEAGVPLMLRYALDDGNDAVFCVSIHCLHSLIVLLPEEHLLDSYLHCYHGYLLPSLRSPDRPPKSHDTDQEEDKETDIETLQRDVVEGLLNMQLLHRLRYILEVCRPPALTVTEVLQLLLRVARHSLSAATQVVNCPRLMKVLFDEFLPLSWTWDGEPAQPEASIDQVAHGRPQVAALKLLLTICSAGRNLTAQLASQYQLLSVLTRYTVLHPTELNLPREEAYQLATTSLQTWTVTLSYAIGDTAFRDTYPVFLRQLQQLSSVGSGPHSLGQLESRRVSALLGLLQAAIRVAAVTPDQLKTDKKNVVLSPPAIEWSHATGMLTPLLQCLSLWVEQTTTGATQVDRVSCMASLLHCVASYYNSVAQKRSCDSLEVLDQVERLAEGVLTKLSKSALLSYALEALRKISVLSTASSDIDPSLSSPPSLPSHLHLHPPPKRPLYNEPIMVQSDFVEMLQPRVVCFTCTNLVLGYLRLCLVSSQLHKGVVNKVVQIFQNAVFMDYLESFLQNTKISCSSFNIVEMSLLYHTVKLFTVWHELSGEQGVDEAMVLLFHHLAFKLLSLLPPGMEWYVSDLISSAVLHPAMFRSSSSQLVERDITSMSLHDPPLPITSLSPSSDESSAPSTLLAQSLERLPFLSSIYLQSLQGGGHCTEKQVNKSKWVLNQESVKVPRVMLPPYHGACLPLDWPLLPLIQEYSKSLSPTKLSGNAEMEKPVSMVTNTLRLLLLLEHLRPKLLRELPTSAKIVRLMCVFLIGSDLFLESDVHSCLVALLRLYCLDHVQSSVDFSAPIPGVVSFTDLYSSLLEQFAAVSYGDHLFSCFVVLPLQQRFSVQLRRLVWKDNPAVIRILSLPIAEIPVNLKNFLYPVERDESLLEAYLAAMATDSVKPSWSPLFYLIATHHLNSAIFDNIGGPENVQLQSRLLQSVLKIHNEETRQHLLMYDGLDEGTTLGFKCRKNLTQDQTSMISEL